jgi:serine/threonine protein kinase
VTPIAPCPGQDELLQLLAGPPENPAVDLLEQHLLQCSDCVEKVRALEALDTWSDLLRSQATIDDSQVEAEAEQLISRVQHFLSAPGSPEAWLIKCNLAAGDVPASPAPRDSQANKAKPFAYLGSPLQEGELGRLDGYRILRVLGQGGMGTVFLAEDLRLGRQVALKAMRPEIAAVPIATERFLREARTAARLDHGNIVPIFHVGEDRGIPFIAMPLLKGESLETRLRRGPKLSVPEAMCIGRQTAGGLSCAHAAGLIHRDIKPGNLWLETRPGGPDIRADEEGKGGSLRVKILDFGLVHQADCSEVLTELGEALGTPGYIAPEQAEGKSVDERADLFSLGVVLYRMLTDRLPYPGKSVPEFMEALTGKAEPPGQLNPGVPQALSELVIHLLAKEPKDRPASAQHVSEQLYQLERAPTMAARYHPHTSIMVSVIRQLKAWWPWK